MAKQGKILEQLVKAIQETIKDSPNTIVSSNVKLTDINGVQREIDVLVETIVHQTPIIIAFECKDYNRPIAIKVVDEFISKCADIPSINSRVIVATKGFSEGARKKAKSHNIQLYTFEDIPLCSLIASGTTYYGRPTYTPENVYFRFKNITEGIVRFIPRAYYSDTNEEYETILTDLVDECDNLLTPSQKLKFAQLFFENKQQPFVQTIRFTPNREIYFIDTEGQKLIIDFIRISFTINFELEQGTVVKAKRWRKGNIDVIEHKFNSTNSRVYVVCDTSITNKCFIMDNDIITPFEVQEKSDNNI